MKTMFILIKRNIKMFFKDKGAFFGTFISPAILLVLYVTFLGNVFRDSLVQNVPSFIKLSEDVVDGFVAGQLISSIIAVTSVTVAFSTNFLMVQDKANRTSHDFDVSPTKSHILSLSYYIASIVASLMICFVTLAICLVYAAIVGWYMTAVDVVLLFVDVIILVLFGTALSSVINFFLSTQGQLTAVNMIVGVCYGFICGAYMPMSEFGEGLQKVLGFFPSTYITSIVRNHAMGGAIEAMAEEMTKSANSEMTKELINEFRDAFDCNLYFFGDKVSTPVMYGVVCGTIVVLLGVYVLLNVIKSKNPNFGVIQKKPKKSKEVKETK